MPKLHRVAGILLASLMVVALVDFGPVVAGAGLPVTLAAALVTTGLALLVATLLASAES